jgi:hypothetical protein
MQVLEIDGLGEVEMSRHAIERALDMGLDGATIRAALEKPANVGYSTCFSTHLYDYKDITVVVAKGVAGGAGRTFNRITTILWRNDKKWRKDLRRGDYGGRTLAKAKAQRASRGGAVT